MQLTNKQTNITTQHNNNHNSARSHVLRRPCFHLSKNLTCNLFLSSVDTCLQTGLRRRSLGLFKSSSSSSGNFSQLFKRDQLLHFLDVKLKCTGYQVWFQFYLLPIYGIISLNVFHSFRVEFWLIPQSIILKGFPWYNFEYFWLRILIIRCSKYCLIYSKCILSALLSKISKECPEARDVLKR